MLISSEELPTLMKGQRRTKLAMFTNMGTRLPDVENSRSITTVQSYQVTIVYATNLGSITLSSTSALRSGGNIVSNRQKHLKSQLKNPPMKQEFEVEECLPSNREHHATDSRIDC